MKRGADLGMRGVKIWKDVSLGMKDKKGRHIPIDDPRLTPIWDTAAKLIFQYSCILPTLWRSSGLWIDLMSGLKNCRDTRIGRFLA